VAELPEIGTPMYLVHSEETNFRSRLEAVVDGTLRVSAPLETSGADEIRPGEEIEVFWAQPRARVILPCRLVEIAGKAPFRWVLEPIGRPRASNRREYVRGGGGTVVQLAAEPDEQSLNGRLLDISEGGLRCWVPRASKISVGDQMTASLQLDTGALELEGTVFSVRDAIDEPGRHLVVTFETNEPTAKRIRQYVFAYELAERRRSINVRTA
jgi:c-di-GMP-binding flagellar brake protein YcgR